jgi:glycosyltransferase involved in cell wall biosynthesis
MSEETAGRRIHVVMGIYRPHEEFLRQQIASILGQSFSNLTLHAVLDGPDDDAERVCRSFGDPRINIVRPADHAGTYRNFGRGLESALCESTSENDVFAFADQDDIWEPEKLAIMTDVVDRKQCLMAICDCSVIDENGVPLAPSLFRLEGRARRVTAESVLAANNASGMAMVFTRAVADVAVPFPPEGDGLFLHDWWLSAVAANAGHVKFVDRPLVRYRSHRRNVVGPRVGGEQEGGEGRSGGLRHAFLRRLMLARCLVHQLGLKGLKPRPAARAIAEKRLSAPLWFAVHTLSALIAGHWDELKGASYAAAGGLLALLRRSEQA